MGVGQDVETQEASPCGWECKICSHLGKQSVVVSQMAKHTVTVRPNNSTPRCRLEADKNVCPCKNVYKNVYSSLSPHPLNSRKVKSRRHPSTENG